LIFCPFAETTWSPTFNPASAVLGLIIVSMTAAYLGVRNPLGFSSLKARAFPSSLVLKVTSFPFLKTVTDHLIGYPEIVF
jgi:hypothetical protein